MSSLLIFYHYFDSPIIDVIVKETSWTNIVESLQKFEHFNEVSSKSPLHEANEFQVHEPLLITMVLDLWNNLYSFLLDSFHFYLSIRSCGNQNWTAYSRCGWTRDL